MTFLSRDEIDFAANLRREGMKWMDITVKLNEVYSKRFYTPNVNTEVLFIYPELRGQTPKRVKAKQKTIKQDKRLTSLLDDIKLVLDANRLDSSFKLNMIKSLVKDAR